MDKNFDLKVQAMLNVGLTEFEAKELAPGATLGQVRDWARRSEAKNSPVPYFRALYRSGVAKPEEEGSEDAPSRSSGPSQELLELMRYVASDDCYYRQCIDTPDERAELLLQFGFHRLEAHELARGSTMEDVVGWIAAVENSPNPQQIVRDGLAWGESPPDPEGEALLRGIPTRELARLLLKWGNVPTERYVTRDRRELPHRPMPASGELRDATPILRALLRKNPWPEVREEGARLIRSAKIPFARIGGPAGSWEAFLASFEREREENRKKRGKQPRRKPWEDNGR